MKELYRFVQECAKIFAKECAKNHRRIKNIYKQRRSPKVSLSIYTKQFKNVLIYYLLFITYFISVVLRKNVGHVCRFIDLTEELHYPQAFAIKAALADDVAEVRLPCFSGPGRFKRGKPALFALTSESRGLYVLERVSPEV